MVDGGMMVPVSAVALGHLGGNASAQPDTSAETITSALLIALVIIIALMIISYVRRHRTDDRPEHTTEKFCQSEPPSQTFEHPEWSAPNSLYPSDVSPDAMWLPDASAIGRADVLAEDAENAHNASHRKSVYQSLARMYSTADVDPMITGQAYAYRDNTRPIYDQRSSHGGVWGLQEFSSSGSPGDVGVDVGPTGMFPGPEAGVMVGPSGLAEYEGAIGTYDDGIPEQWAFPSTPVQWYKPRQRDYIGPEGPTPYTDGMFQMRSPDHDPLIGEDEGPDY
jgi:hypothetical protein